VSEVYFLCEGNGLSLLGSGDKRSKLCHCQFRIIPLFVAADLQIDALNFSQISVETSTRGYVQIGCHMNTLFRRQVVSYLGSGVLFSTKGSSECIFSYAHLKWT
jgi:hypothetical protein